MKILLKIVEMISCFVIWLILLLGFTQASIFLSKEVYQPEDVPHERFEVVVSNDDVSIQAEKWNIAKVKPHKWVKTAKKCVSEDCLLAMNDGSLVYHNEGALWYSESKYRIEGNKIIPVSFVMFTFIHALLAMFLAFIVLVMGRYMFKRWRLRGLEN